MSFFVYTAICTVVWWLYQKAALIKLGPLNKQSRPWISNNNIFMILWLHVFQKHSKTQFLKNINFSFLERHWSHMMKILHIEVIWYHDLSVECRILKQRATLLSTLYQINLFIVKLLSLYGILSTVVQALSLKYCQSRLLESSFLMCCTTLHVTVSEVRLLYKTCLGSIRIDKFCKFIGLHPFFQHTKASILYK